MCRHTVVTARLFFWRVEDAFVPLQIYTQVYDVVLTTRLKESPAIISSHESGALRKMMQMIEHQGIEKAMDIGKQKMEINPK